MIEAEQGTELQSTAHGKEGTVADAEEAANLKPGIRIHPVIWGQSLACAKDQLSQTCDHLNVFLCQSQWRPWIVWRRCRRPSGTRGRAIRPLRGVMMNWSPYLRPMESGSAWALTLIDALDTMWILGLKDGECYSRSIYLPVCFMTTVLRFQMYSFFFPIVNMRVFLQPQAL